MSKYETMTVDQLVAESQSLGAQVDKLKEERRAIKQVLDAKLAALAAAPKSEASVDATVGGVALVAEANKE